MEQGASDASNPLVAAGGSLGEGVVITADPQEAPASVDLLPGGAAMGVFLHEVLEHLDYQEVASFEYTEYLADPGLHRLFERSATRHAIGKNWLLPAKELIWKTLRTPVRCGPLAFERGLCEIQGGVPEMGFLYPIPEASHPRLDQQVRGSSSTEALPFRVEKGFIRGVIDLVFEYEGRTYFLDWKSDRLEDYGRAQEHVEEHYALQAQLYAIGIVRQLRLHRAADYEARFGGMLYSFLRGMPAAMTFERPAFEVVRAWEEELQKGDLLFRGDEPLVLGEGVGHVHKR